VPPSYALPGGPVRLDGPVVRGFGRGSRQMGVPTANIDPEPLAGILEGMPKGVYFGWACLRTSCDKHHTNTLLGEPPRSRHHTANTLANTTTCTTTRVHRWAQLDAPSDWPDADRAVHKMVMNVGRRPTVEQVLLPVAAVCCDVVLLCCCLLCCCLLLCLLCLLLC
jgi:FAD synthase